MADVPDWSYEEYMTQMSPLAKVDYLRMEEAVSLFLSDCFACTSASNESAK